MTSHRSRSPHSAASEPARAFAGPTPRRGFLRGLCTLPLIGGGVTLIGAPTAVASEPSRLLLESYSAWLEFERRYLDWTLWPGLALSDRPALVPCSNAGASFHHGHPSVIGHEAQQRAAVVLAAVGCQWQGRGMTLAELTEASR